MRPRVQTKPDLTPVTEADRAVETAIRDGSRSCPPGDAVVGEEFGVTGERRRAVGSSTRSTARRLRPRLAGVGDAARAGGRTASSWSASCRRRRSAGAGGRPRGGGAFVNGDADRGVEGRRASRTRSSLRRRRVTYEAFGARRREFPRWRATCLAPARLRRLLGPHARGRRLDRHRCSSPSSHVWDVAARRARSSRRPAAACTDLARRRPRRRRQRGDDQRPPARRRARLVSERRVMAPTWHEVTVGIDIGTSSVKAIAADGDGNVVASARASRTSSAIPTPERFEHDAAVAWRTGRARRSPRRGRSDARPLRGVSVAAMVPSLTAVDDDGEPLLPGLLYGDERGRAVWRGRPGTRSRAASSASSSGGWSTQRPTRHGLLARAGRGQSRARRRGGARHVDRGDRVARCSTARVGRSARHRRRRARRAVPAPRADRLGGGRAFGSARRTGAALASGCIDALRRADRWPAPTTTATCS